MSPARDAGRSGFESAVVGLFRDVRMLVRQEAALAKHEFEYETGKIIKAVVWFALACVIIVIGLVGISATCVLILFEDAGLPAWTCTAIVSVMLLGGAGGLVTAGWGMAKSFHIVPVRTVRTLVDDLKWVAEWVLSRYA